MDNHKPTPQYFWKGRSADSLEYWHQKVRCTESLSADTKLQKKIALLGYAVDEGVRRNQGRVGAQIGPDSIKSVMGSMAYHLPESLEILDYGNIWLEGSDLESIHELTQSTILELLRSKHFPVILGGGHDLSFPHGSAIIDHVAEKGETLGILNLDAHFDLREKVNGQGHSGSPFLQLHEYAKSKAVPLQYVCLGIQKAANPSPLFATAKKTGTWWLESESCNILDWDKTRDLLNSLLDKVNKVYLSIDLDAFSSAYAPGVSAASPMGFTPDYALKVLEYLAQSKKLISMDVVELNPSFDQDLCTAKLAARCIEFTLRKIWE
ncbi:formiminoglutamase [Belliella buryatensis]|uniref:Formimidoylglutamase n=1 Tax=Belliella buryatensis TaxID=1500549 RepID=A0A239AHI7_9BACT|nr:formimidoylglutamase [Belliella buryatensis]SNR95126.1 formiminoglutamase [Belliella buryatensis]